MPVAIKATDFYRYQTCQRIVYLDYNGNPDLRRSRSAYDQYIMQQGQQHEDAVIDQMTHAPAEPGYTIGDLPSGARATRDLMRQGVTLIYQGVLVSGDLVGIPDLLQRIDGPSNLGDYHYRPIDIKMSSRNDNTGYHQQVMAYCHLLEQVQGVRPDGALWLQPPTEERSGNGQFVEYPVIFDEDMFFTALEQVRAATDAAADVPPSYTSTCKSCAWFDVCVPDMRNRRDVSLVYKMQGKVAEQLRERGVLTVDQLAKLNAEDLLSLHGVGKITAGRIIEQAQAMATGQPVIRNLPDLQKAPVEAFFDVESIPGDNLIYLFGVAIRDENGVRFEYDLAEHAGQQEAAWNAFLTRMDTFDGPVYHYGTYEKTVVRQLVATFGEAPRADRIQARLVDIEKMLKNSVVLPLLGYSLKDVDKYIGFKRSDTMKGDDSILEYLAWLEDGDYAHLERIISYNEEDCRATLAIRDWLDTLGEDASPAEDDDIPF